MTAPDAPASVTRLWRVVLWPDASPPRPLRFPREFQGAGRHDNPAVYGCLYAAEAAVSAVAEALAPFRGSGRLRPEMLRRPSGQLALASLILRRAEDLLDLDRPDELVRIGLRPSDVATRRRSTTQAWAARVHQREPRASGLRWWSTLEASWINVTVFDRAARSLELEDVRLLADDDPAVRDASALLGLA